MTGYQNFKKRNMTYHKVVDMNIKLSVIIACYNAELTLAEQLEAMMIQDWSEPWEVIISNNRSTDNSLAIARSYQKKMPKLRIIDAFELQGKPHALNKGISKSKGEYLVFCDADDVVAPGYIQAMGNALKEFEFVAAGFDFEKLNSQKIIQSRKNPQQNGLQRYSYPPFLNHAGGGSLGIRRSVFNSVGGFDVAFPILEDTDLCFKVQLSGFKLHFVPEAKVYVRLRDSTMHSYRQARNYGEYNVKLYKKYRNIGMPKISRSSGLKILAKALLETHHIRDENSRLLYFRQWGWIIGRLKGCIKYRTWAL
jgi:cellulose synthase/poly-beta-1,6-N-acetylglucosamine synthase-like glycosyltransferase